MITVQQTQIEQDQRDILAQWAFDTRPILGRFHLWLEGVEIEWSRGQAIPGQSTSFVNNRIERLLAMTAAATALGTRVYGPFGGGAGQVKSVVNQVKKDADAISAYVMSESLWYLTRQLPENHAIMVCLGEGLMPKAGETPEMGANPQLGFGRVYARPEVAQWLDERVSRLLNDVRYGWDDFYGELKRSGITVWGAAIDTLENTSRFAMGSPTGPMTVLHLFNQPLHVLRPYEGYVGNLILPTRVVEAAAQRAILVNFRTPRSKVLEAIITAYPGLRKENVHVWTLGGNSRTHRIGGLWKAWTDLGVHVVEDGWMTPTGLKAFTDSGTYAPVYQVGTWHDENGQMHLLICDGYAASAEALQAASLGRILGFEASLNVFTSRFLLPYDIEQDIMQLDPDAPDFSSRLEHLLGTSADEEVLDDYHRMINEGLVAGLDLHKRTLRADDFFPEKRWEMLAAVGYMLPDPYTGAPGVETVAPDTWRVTVRMVTEKGDKNIVFTLRLMETFEQGRLVFSPLLNRFLAGEDYQRRSVKISDSGRIRNELQTLCAEALEFPGDEHIRVYFDRISPAVISTEQQARLLEILQWYKVRHPLWFSWLEVVP